MGHGVEAREQSEPYLGTERNRYLSTSQMSEMVEKKESIPRPDAGTVENEPFKGTTPTGARMARLTNNGGGQGQN